MTDDVKRLRQDFDFLGSLSRNLRDLQGYDTLAFELIQNADDVKDENGYPATTRISFDVRDDALVVENDGVFRDIDFERMKLLAGEGKREEEETTGAFGIGFTVVYQITDTPELFSSGRHWRFIPIDFPNNIEERFIQVQGTIFRLPYATDANTETRLRLKQQAFDVTKLDQFQEYLCDAIFSAALFLKQLQTLEVKRNGKLIRQINREVSDNEVWLTDNGVLSSWKLLHGNFELDDKILSSQHLIEKKRHNRIMIAIPDEVLKQGQLFAVLPTNNVTGLPFHINADFFTKSDRKQIIFENINDYQSQWNRAIVRATAQIIINNFEDIKRHFGYKGIWQFLQQIKNCSDRASQGVLDDVFYGLWNTVKSSIANYHVVFTTAQKWAKSGNTRFIQSDEYNAIPIFEGLNVSIVHTDLNSYHNLLLELGVRSLSIDDIVTRLREVGLDQSRHISEAPSKLQTSSNWQILWQALGSLLNRASKQRQDIDKDNLRGCAIFLGDDDILHMVSEINKGDEETKSLFWWLKWLDSSADTTHLPGSLIDTFSVADAIRELGDRQDLEELWKQNKFDLPRLFDWFQDNHKEFEKYGKEKLHARLRDLPIFPVADSLQPLSKNLYIAGDFEDPIGITTLIDTQALGNKKEFLQKLGVQTLDLITYIRNEIPKYFEPEIQLSVEQFRSLIKLLAERLGIILEHQDLHRILTSLPLVECINLDTPAYADEVYLGKEVQQILGEDVLIAKPNKSEAVQVFYEWLGVAKEPRIGDIITRIKEITSEEWGDYKASVGVIAQLFELLGSRLGDMQDQELANLKTMPWLPAKQKGKSLLPRWFAPKQVYNTFQHYLFAESDAYFLDFDISLQTKTRDLSNQLGINPSPTSELVAEHLIRSIAMKNPVHLQVYEMLNNAIHKNPNEEWLSELRGKRCIWLNGIYVEPSWVYWGEHPFGEYRAKLSREWARYDNLLNLLGVKESPDFDDFCNVLYEIEIAFMEKPISSSGRDIIIGSFKELSKKLQEGIISSEELFEKLAYHKVLPNRDDILVEPVNLLFEDRQDIAQKFDDKVGVNIVPKIESAWHAMESAGVRTLSTALDAYVVEPLNAIEDRDLAQLIYERKDLFKRILDTQTSEDNRERIELFFEDFRVKKTDEIVVLYHLDIFDGKESAPQKVKAFWREEDATLYYVAEGKTTIHHIAREIALALYPAINITSGIKEVIDAESYKEARELLTIQGYASAREDYEISDNDIDDNHLRINMEHADANSEDSEVSTNNNNQTLFPNNGNVGDNNVEDDEASDSHKGDRHKRDHDFNASKTSAGNNRPNSAAKDNKANAANWGKADKSNQNKQGSGKNRPSQRDDDKNKNRRPSGKLRSYVSEEVDTETTDVGKAKAAERSEVDNAGIRFVLKHEKSEGRMPVEMPHYNVGFDVLSHDKKEEERYIEVKSLSGTWNAASPAALTKAQFETARKKGENYWLYVVEQALSPKPRLHKIQNPAERINQYLFDDGWQAVDEEE